MHISLIAGYSDGEQAQSLNPLERCSKLLFLSLYTVRVSLLPLYAKLEQLKNFTKWPNERRVPKEGLGTSKFYDVFLRIAWLVRWSRDRDHPGLSPGEGHCLVFLGETLDSYSASLHQGV